jgi:[pyruvate, water dikinase]-phosphate phosphotransferase / [pyruvate, water dikinase] kinase
MTRRRLRKWLIDNDTSALLADRPAGKSNDGQRMKRTAFFISDSTGITAETLGKSLLAQFDNIEFDKIVLPFIDTAAKAQRAADRINDAADRDGAPPIIFDTIVNQQIRAIIAASNGVLLDIFSTFLAPLEQALGTQSSVTVGRGHSHTADRAYQQRIAAVHYALANDDGAQVSHYDQAQLILIGVSRSGKTPTCLYMAMQQGIYAANYPLTDEDLERGQIPRPLQTHRHKLYGLTINPERLSAIRNERRANSGYANISKCEDEVRMAEALFRRNQIRCIDTTHISIEEIATKILQETGLREHIR